MGGKQRTHIHPFLDPKLALESIGEVPRVPRAHLEVEFAQTIVRFSPPLYGRYALIRFHSLLSCVRVSPTATADTARRRESARVARARGMGIERETRRAPWRRGGPSEGGPRPPRRGGAGRARAIVDRGGSEESRARWHRGRVAECSHQ